MLELAPGAGEPPGTTVRRLVEHRTWASSVGLDCHAHYATGRGADLLPTLAETFAAGTFPLAVLPVLRPDSPERLVDEAAAVVAETGAGAYLRAPAIAAPYDRRAVDRLLERARLPAERTDLLLDVGEVAKDGALPTAVDRALAALTRVTELEWRSITLLSGGWPTRRRLPLPPAVTVLPRNDATLWTRVRAEFDGPPLGFGDFGVRAPTAIGGGGRGSPAPYLRYTVDVDWELWRWPKTPDGGLDLIQALCRELTRSAGYTRYGPAYSWGDAEIARAAEPAADRRSPLSWVAWSLSHHLAVVTERLQHLGLP